MATTYNLVHNVVKMFNNTGSGFYVKLPGTAPTLQEDNSKDYCNLVSGNGTAYAFFLDESQNLNLQQLGTSSSWVLGSYGAVYQACMWGSTICFCVDNGNIYQITFGTGGSPTVATLAELDQGMVMLAANTSLWALANNGTQLFQLTSDGWNQIQQPNIPSIGMVCFASIAPYVMAGGSDGSIRILDESTGVFSSTPVYQANEQITSLCGRSLQLNEKVAGATAYSVSIWFTTGSNGLAGIIYQSGNNSSSPSATSYYGIQPALDISWIAFSSQSGLLYTLPEVKTPTLASFDPVVGAWHYVSSGNQKNTIFANQKSGVGNSPTTFHFSSGPDGTGNTGSSQIYVNSEVASSVPINEGKQSVTVNQSVWRKATPNDVKLPLRWPFYPVNIGLKLHVGGGWIITDIDMDPIMSQE